MNLVAATFVILTATVIAAGQKHPLTIFLAGDSTMAQKQADKRPETGWGEMLGQHFKDGKVVIDNRAANGRSTKSFLAEGKWQGIVDANRAITFSFSSATTTSRKTRASVTPRRMTFAAI